MTRVVVVDDHPTFRDGVRAVLSRAPDIDVVGECGTGEELLERCDTDPPDVVLLDLLMPGIEGLETARRMSVMHPDVAVLVVTMSDADESVYAALRAGARGYVLKEAPTASVAVLISRRNPSPFPRRVAFVGLAIVVATALVTTASYLNRTAVDPAEGEAVLTHSGTAVSPADVVVTADEGPATLVVRNDDWLYRRSFDIDALDIHEVIPPRTGLRIELPPVPGTFEFYDFITFTPATEGTVVVREH